MWTATTGVGTRRAPVVILHGGPGLWDDYEVLAGMLDDLTVVHRFDQRGCGRSDPSATQTMARLARDIDELRAYFGHSRIVVIGHSFGATLALKYAAAYADRVAGVVYLDGVGVGDWRTPYYAERARRMTPEQAARLEELSGRTEVSGRPRSSAEETEFRALSWFTDHADRERAMTWAYASAVVDLPINFAANSALGAEINGWSAEEVKALVAAVRAPITFVHGEHDPRPATAVRELAEAAPNHTFELIPDAGHSPWLEQPELVREVLRAAVE
ncbi:alpha/beta fold hydrolase [Kribbella solani]|uniref:Proline iminopeptidase n=1 Tax=Kribbella solani TaxID=236067 RepID=A0A841DU14_9ACTN|nr:alpha/beta hydrolase [Kribbella solani]MBB5980220.1 proline iminopeptidase [Kribbella solani]